MFGNKKEKDGEDGGSTTSSHMRSISETPAPNAPSSTDGSNVTPSSPPQKQDELSADAKKRRGSSTAKAREIFTQAKNSLIHGDKDGPQTPLQKLSKTDAALGVPQGSLNNSAGESQPTSNSSFKVGVTEDKNKKCRRTMEDTHSYLYNFLGTPAPIIPDTATAGRPADEKAKAVSGSDDSSQQMIETDNGYFAVFDGHAGTFAAEWCGKKLHLILEDLMRKNPNTPVPELLDQTFTTADNQLEKLPLKNSGCTAICAVLRWEDRVPTSQSATGSQAIAPLAAAAAAKAEADLGEGGDGKDSGPARSNSVAEAAQHALQEARQKATRQRVLYTANVGDARIVLCRNGKALRLSYDHKGLDENEGRRISKAGGLILNNRVNGVLAVTRALGDSYLKDLVTGHPYTTETVIQHDQDEFLILACDGLWDVCSDQEAVNLVRDVKSPQDASKVLVEHALARFSTDNLSVMIVRFDAEKLQTNARKGIGVQNESSQPLEGVSEAEMIVEEVRRNSVMAVDGTLTEEEEEEIREEIVKDIEQSQSRGPETSPGIGGATPTSGEVTPSAGQEDMKLQPPPPPVNETKS